MIVDSFIISFSIYIIPGYIGFLFYCKLRSNSHLADKKHAWIIVFNIFTFTLISYLLFDFISMILSSLFAIERIYIFDKILDQSRHLTPIEIFKLIVVSLLLGLVLAFLENNNIISRLFNKIKITNVVAKEDVWSYCVKNKKFEWVYIRDFSKELLYYAHIDKYSLTDERRELLLSNVEVFSINDSNKLFSCDFLYLSVNDSDLTLEVNPIVEIKENQNGERRRSKNSSSTRKRKTTREK